MQLLEKYNELKNDGKLEEARKLIGQLAEDNPTDTEVLLEAGSIHKQMEMFPQAIAFYKDALELDLSEDERKHVLFHLGASYRAVGLYDQAKEIFEIGMSEYPAANEFYIYFAMTLYNLDDTDLALEIMLTKLIETTKDQGILEHKNEFSFYASRLDELFN